MKFKIIKIPRKTLEERKEKDYLEKAKRADELRLPAVAAGLRRLAAREAAAQEAKPRRKSAKPSTS